MNKASMILAALALFVSTAAWAQPGPQGGMMAPPPGMMDGSGPGACQDTCAWNNERKMLEAVRISRMTEELQLTDQQIAQFFPKLKEMEANLRETGRHQQKLLGQLDSLLAAGAKDPELKAKMTQIENDEAERRQRMKMFKAKLDGILTVKQQARMLVFNRKFDDEIRDMVRDIRQKKMRRFGQ